MLTQKMKIILKTMMKIVKIKMNTKIIILKTTLHKFLMDKIL